MFFSVNKKVVFTFLIRILIVFSVFLVTSCDMDDNITESFADQDTYEARLDDAVIKMDNGEYQAAKDILDELLLENPGDEYLLELLASCYVGIAGIDSLSALDKIDNVTDSAEELSPSDVLATILGDDNGDVTSAGINATLDNLDAALDSLNSISNPTEDQLSQIALFSAYRVLANVTSVAIDVMGDPLVLDGITLSGNIDSSNFTAAQLDEIATDFTSMFKIPSTNALYDPINELADNISTTTPNSADIAAWIDAFTD